MCKTMTEQQFEARRMSVEEQSLGDRVYAAVQDASNFSERSQQSADFRMGVSDIGWCSEKVRRMIAGIPEPVTDKLAAFIGTAIGDHVEQAYIAKYPEMIRQAEVTIKLISDTGSVYEVGGHPDLIDPVEGLVIDVKTSRGLGTAMRTGPNQQQQFQRHAYALGAFEAGLFPNHTLDQIRVANVWLDRSADYHEPWVQMERYNPEVVEAMTQWVDEVVYAYIHGEEARKEPSREMCEKVCGHFADCRALDTDVEGLLTDKEVLAAVDMHRAGGDLERAGKRLKDEAKATLKEIKGSTGTYTVRWVDVGPSEVNYVRAGYQKLDIRKIR